MSNSTIAKLKEVSKVNWSTELEKFRMDSFDQKHLNLAPMKFFTAILWPHITDILFYSFVVFGFIIFILCGVIGPSSFEANAQLYFTLSAIASAFIGFLATNFVKEIFFLENSSFYHKIKWVFLKSYRLSHIECLKNEYRLDKLQLLSFYQHKMKPNLEHNLLSLDSDIQTATKSGISSLHSTELRRVRYILKDILSELDTKADTLSALGSMQVFSISKKMRLKNIVAKALSVIKRSKSIADTWDDDSRQFESEIESLTNEFTSTLVTCYDKIEKSKDTLKSDIDMLDSL